MVELIETLKEKSRANNAPAWKRLAKELEKPARQRRSVNLYKVAKYCRDGEIAVVPGKLLGVGELDKPVTIAAFSFSKEAKSKVAKQGKALSIAELLEKHPKAEKVRIIG